MVLRFRPNRLRKARLRQGLSQEALADRMTTEEDVLYFYGRPGRHGAA